MGLGDCRIDSSTDASDLLLLFLSLGRIGRKGGSSNEYFLGNDFAADCITAGFGGVCPYQLYKRRADERAKVDVGCNHRMYQYYRADFIFHRRQKAKVSRYAVY